MDLRQKVFQRDAALALLCQGHFDDATALSIVRIAGDDLPATITCPVTLTLIARAYDQLGLFAKSRTAAFSALGTVTESDDDQQWCVKASLYLAHAEIRISDDAAGQLALNNLKQIQDIYNDRSCHAAIAVASAYYALSKRNLAETSVLINSAKDDLVLDSIWHFRARVMEIAVRDDDFSKFPKTAAEYIAMADEALSAGIYSVAVLCHSNAGGNYNLVDMHQAAAQSLLQCVKISRRYLRIEHVYLASAYMNIGSNYFRRGDHRRAHLYYQKSIARLARLGHFAKALSHLRLHRDRLLAKDSQSLLFKRVGAQVDLLSSNSGDSRMSLVAQVLAGTLNGDQQPTPNRKAGMGALEQMLDDYVMSNQSLRNTVDKIIYTDVLTQMPNRAQFEYDAKRRLGERYFAVLLFDLNKFKSINDAEGHSAGDDVLRHVAQALMALARSGVSPYRWGGDEFIVLIDDPHENVPSTVAESIQERLSQITNIHTVRFGVSASLGCAYYPQHGETIEELVRHADLAMYVAKRSADLSLVTFTPQFLQESQAKHQLARSFDDALNNGELVMHWQPITSLDTMSSLGVESLVRWKRSDGTLLRPASFLHLLESDRFGESASISIFESVLREFSQSMSHHDQFVSVNVPRQLLQGGDAIERLAKIAGAMHIPTERICLEVNVTDLDVEQDALHSPMARIKNAGFKLGIDNFALQTANFNDLAQFPVDILKVSATLIERAFNDRRFELMATQLITLCRQLDITVVFDCVENTNQLVWLLEHDVQWMQGYLFAEPVAELDTALNWRGNCPDQLEDINEILSQHSSS